MASSVTHLVQRILAGHTQEGQIACGKGVYQQRHATEVKHRIRARDGGGQDAAGKRGLGVLNRGPRERGADKLRPLVGHEHHTSCVRWHRHACRFPHTVFAVANLRGEVEQEGARAVGAEKAAGAAGLRFQKEGLVVPAHSPTPPPLNNFPGSAPNLHAQKHISAQEPTLRPAWPNKERSAATPAGLRTRTAQGCPHGSPERWRLGAAGTWSGADQQWQQRPEHH